MKNIKVHFYGEIHARIKGRYIHQGVNVDAETFKELMEEAKERVKYHFEAEFKGGKKFFVRNIIRQLESTFPTYQIK